MMSLYTRVAIAALLLSGCQGSRTIGGQVDQTQFRLEGAQAIAIASDGKIYRSHVGADGRFELALHTDATYTLRFANSTGDATKYDAFAVLIQQAADGSRHENFRLTAGDPIELGLIRRSGTLSLALTAASDDEAMDNEEESEDDDDDTDSDGRRDDDLTACDLSGGSDLVTAEAENSLLSENDSDDDGVSDDEDSDDCDSDSDSDDEAAETEEAEDDDSDSDSDSEAGMVCEDAADMMDEECSEGEESEPAPNPGAGSDAPDCAADPTAPGCV